MKNNIIITTVLLASAFTFSNVAQDSVAPQRPGRPGGPGGPGGPGRGMRPPPLIAALDANKDGIIDAAEIANAGVALAKLDKNGDGQITEDEIHPPRPADAPEPPADAPKRPVPPVMAALDTDKDGILSARELGNAAASLATLDKNGDGVLTPDEFMGHGPHPGGPGGPGEHGPRGERGGPGQRGPRPDAPKE